MTNFARLHPLVRRFFTIGILPIALVIVGLYFVFSIILGFLLGVRRKNPTRHTRLALMLIWYLLFELLGVLIALILWFGTIFGYKMKSSRSQDIHASVQYFWVTSVLKGASFFLRTRVQFPESVPVPNGPCVIAAQHSSFFDALIPTVLVGIYFKNVIPRHVLKSELLLSPSLDIYGNRLPNQFVNRESGNAEQEIAGIRSLANNLGSNAMIIFPEGTFYTDRRFKRIIQKITATDSDRADRISSLQNLLPVKPGGISAMLTASPESGLYLVAHRGFEPFGSFKEILANIPFNNPVEIFIKFVPPAKIPREKNALLEFIDYEWLALDTWLESKVVSDASSS